VKDANPGLVARRKTVGEVAADALVFKTIAVFVVGTVFLIFDAVEAARLVGRGIEGVAPAVLTTRETACGSIGVIRTGTGFKEGLGTGSNVDS
jgi:hypothetical protein